MCMNSLVSNLSHIMLSMWRGFQTAQGQESLGSTSVYFGKNASMREAEARINDNAYAHT